MSLLYVGCDLETSGTEVDQGHVPIQIGISLGVKPDENFCSKIAWYPEEMVWSDRSAEVHKIPREQVTQVGYKYWYLDRAHVDFLIIEWLRGIYPSGIKQGNHFVIPIGWNVGQFDLPFIKRYLPLFNSYISRRTIDLNAVVYTMDGQIEHGGSYPTYKGWKKMSKDYAAAILEKCNFQTTWHDAGYDAAAGLLSWEFLRAAIAGKPFEI
jgi:hypothetical protein